MPPIKPMERVIIIAPHPDDEIIGCASILNKAAKIYYGSPVPKHERLRQLAAYAGGLYDISGIPPEDFIARQKNLRRIDGACFFFPDPYFETHPLHRTWGAVGERLLRAGVRVIFYSTNMNAPYISEVDFPDRKRHLLELIYPEKKDLWMFDHKYFLFEGFCEWHV